MIISASRRTDIPALYSDWFFNRIKEQYVYVRNPVNTHQISNIDLSPEVVDCIVFWTKNAKPMIEKLKNLEKYKYYFQYTVTNYSKEIELKVPALDETVNTFRIIYNLIGKKRIIWRYDPIVLTYKFDLTWHRNNFEKLCEKLCQYTDKCVISFVDYYKNSKSNLKGLECKEISTIEMQEISFILNTIAAKYNLRLESCSEAVDLRNFGINHGKCIDDKLIEEIIKYDVKIPKDNNQRSECGCVASIDIGTYNTCTNGCLYCYANTNGKIANFNYLSHDVNSPLLFGEIEINDKISIRKCAACKVFQNDLFFNKHI